MSDEHVRLERALETNHWTVGSLKDYLDTRLEDLWGRIDDRFRAQDKATDAAFLAQETAMKAALTAAKEAVDKAEKLATTRAESQNEWRGTVSDIIKTNEGKGAGVSATVAWIFGGIGAFVGIAGFIFAIITAVTR